MEENKKRYLFLLKTDTWGGAERRMAAYCSSADFSACDVTWAVLKDVFSARFREQGTPIRALEFPAESLNGSLASKARSFHRFVAAQRPDVIVASNFWLTSISTWEMTIASVVTRGNAYMIVHDCPPVPARYQSKKHLGFIPGIGLSWYLHRLDGKLLTRLPKRTFAVNEKVKQHLVGHFGFSPEKIDIIHFGVDIDHFKPSAEDRREVRARYGIGERDIVLVSTSRLHKRKRLERVLAAFAAAAGKRDDLWLILAGEGEEFAKLFSLARSFGKRVSRRIIFTGYVADVAPLMQAGDIFVFSSDTDGFANALLEAMASGLVVVMTRCNGPESHITDGVTGIAAENTDRGVIDGVRRALAMSQAERAAVGASARAFVAKTFDRQGGIDEFLSFVGIPRRAEITVTEPSAVPAPAPALEKTGATLKVT